MYRLEYLPEALRDMADITRYISHELCNPGAAEKLAAEMIEAADGLETVPYANAAFQPIRPLKHKYRKLVIKNYILFCWVAEKEKTVTVARVIYARRELRITATGLRFHWL